jgi:hypothetical protein
LAERLGQLSLGTTRAEAPYQNSAPILQLKGLLLPWCFGQENWNKSFSTSRLWGRGDFEGRVKDLAALIVLIVDSDTKKLDLI